MKKPLTSLQAVKGYFQAINWMTGIGFLALLTLVFSSCQTTYIPQMPTMPLLSQDGEVQVGTSIGNNGFNAHAVWAPVEHLAFMGAASTFTVSDSVFEPDFRRSFAELGLGYWTRLNKYLRLETFAGMGWGVTGEFPRRDIFRRYFFQPNFGASTRFYDFGFSPRISMVRFVKCEGCPTPVTEAQQSVFIEPIIMGRVGYEEFKFQFQVGPMFSAGNSPFEFDRWNVSFGVNLTLGKDFERYTYTPQ